MFSKELFRRWTYQVFAPGVLLREKYNAFRELLRFDDACLELIAAIEDIHYGAAAVDWTRVVHLARRLRSAVEEMVTRLTRLAPSRYLDLPEYAKKVDFYVQMALDIPVGDMSPPFVMPLDAQIAGRVAVAGGKAANLARAGNEARVPVPEGFVVTTGAFAYFLEASELRPKIDRLLRRVDLAKPGELAAIASEIRQLVMAARVPEEVAVPLLEAATRLGLDPDGNPRRLAARSSAVAEDDRASFAGQYESLLDVAAEDALAAYQRVVAGKYSAKALTYRILTGYADSETPMAVLYLPMVPAAASGVLYTRDSADPEAPMAAYAVPGLGSGLVEGTTSPERLALTHTPPHSLLDRQSLDGPVLPEAAATRLAALGLALERAFGAPQDVEWVLTPQGDLMIVQSRPMAVEPLAPEPVAPPAAVTTRPLLDGALCASAGAACGRVHFAATVLDVEAIVPGTVLVTPTLPTTLARAVDRLAAVVTLSGSRAGHFASVAREFGLPVLCGAVTAFEVLTEGDEVTVDADSGTVYPGCQPALLSRTRRARQTDGSPVAERLSRLVPLLAGLSLTDPSSPDFSPAKVRSLHDIVRFAHEKAVTEMFSLVGNDARGLASAKKLKSHLPLTMYLLDLGGGVFESAAADKELRPDQIRCAPMWALWSGMAADDAPWPEGPPMLDDETFDRTSGGIFTASSRHLASYAVISDTYAHVMLRFGYHFTVVDALCGPEENQNYINFRLKGGGASFARRTLRVACLRRVLTHFGFTVRAAGDLLDASLNREPEQILQKRLAMLGCLLAATRLLDMRLENEDDAEAFVASFLERTDR